MSNSIFKVYDRKEIGNNKKLRSMNKIPGIIYGEFLETPIPVSIEKISLIKMLKFNNSGSIIKLSLNDSELNCVVKEVQKNHLHEILHVDLQYIKPNEVIKMRIPIKIIGQESLEAKRLTLETHNLFIDLQGDVEKIPESIEINVSYMKANDKLLIENIAIPEEITVISDPKTLLAVTSSQL